jgi:hypothetical protein
VKSEVKRVIHFEYTKEEAEMLDSLIKYRISNLKKQEGSSAGFDCDCIEFGQEVLNRLEEIL